MEKFRDFALKYLKIAEKDFERAKRNFDFEDYEAVTFYAQQCVEKSVKSVLELHGIFIKEHEISNEFALLAKKEKFDENFSRKILTALEFFKLDWSRTRYPFIFKGEVTDPEEYLLWRRESTTSFKNRRRYFEFGKRLFRTLESDETEVNK